MSGDEHRVLLDKMSRCLIALASLESGRLLWQGRVDSAALLLGTVYGLVEALDGKAAADALLVKLEERTKAWAEEHKEKGDAN